MPPPSSEMTSFCQKEFILNDFWNRDNFRELHNPGNWEKTVQWGDFRGRIGPGWEFLRRGKKYGLIEPIGRRKSFWVIQEHADWKEEQFQTVQFSGLLRGGFFPTCRSMQEWKELHMTFPERRYGFSDGDFVIFGPGGYYPERNMILRITLEESLVYQHDWGSDFRPRFLGANRFCRTNCDPILSWEPDPDQFGVRFSIAIMIAIIN